MAVDFFIKIGSLKGESVDKGHPGEIDVLAWSWGMSQSGSTHQGSGGGSGKVNVQDLSFTKYMDKASTFLMGACCAGTHYPEATLVARKAGGDAPVEYLKITMTDLIITNVSTGGSGGQDRLTENVTLNFSKVRVGYVPQKPNGAPDSEQLMTWDIAKNCK